MVLAEITPSHHTISKAFFEYQNLKRHWITSFTLVEHDRSMNLFFGSVQSRIFQLDERILNA
ncbi:hypothetical protein SAMN05428969_2484 [Devosia sp. YR412]|nr:hypothetical protein SAMN05428969_2484 [Devosia sp. YR412]